MKVVVDMDISDCLDECSSETRDFVDRLESVFGYEATSDVLGSWLYREELDDFDRIIRTSRVSIIKEAVAGEFNGIDKLDSRKMLILGITREEAEAAGIPIAEEIENGHHVRWIRESKDQMVLFPEMEKGLPPAMIKVVVD